MTMKNKFVPLQPKDSDMRNDCRIVGVVSGKPFVLSDGRPLYRVHTFRYKVFRNDFSLDDFVLQEVLVLDNRPYVTRLSDNQLVVLEGVFGRLDLDDVKYGFCSVCGADLSFDKLCVSVLFLDKGKIRVIRKADGFSYVEQLDELQNYMEECGYGGFGVHLTFHDIDVKDVVCRPHESLPDTLAGVGDMTEYRVDGLVDILFVHPGFDPGVTVSDEVLNGHITKNPGRIGLSFARLVFVPSGRFMECECQRCHMVSGYKHFLPLFVFDRQPVVNKV